MSEPTYTENIERYSPTYKEYIVPSFVDAVETIITHDEQPKERFILLDIDGVLLENIDKVPVYSLLNRSRINDINQTHIMYLKEIYNDNLAIVTDRNPKLNLFLSSKYIVEKVKEVNIPTEQPIPIFHSLNKQFCTICKEKKDEVVQYIAMKLKNKDEIILTSIEDDTFTVPNRDIFLLYIAKELYRKQRIKCDIENYVVKKTRMV